MDYYSFESHLIIFVLFSIRMEIKTTTYQEEEEEAKDYSLLLLEVGCRLIGSRTWELLTSPLENFSVQTEFRSDGMF